MTDLDTLKSDVAELLADILQKRALQERKRRRQAQIDYDHYLARKSIPEEVQVVMLS